MIGDIKIKTRDREIYKVTIVGSVANLILVIFKLLSGIIGRSGAMVADAVHSLSDLATDIVVLVFVRISAKPQDAKYDYGYGKYETLATALIGIVLVAVGVGLLWKGSVSIWRVCHGAELPRPGVVALVAALVSIAVKEILFRYGRKKGRELHSSLLHANAWHHRSDALSSIGAAVGILGAILLGHKWTVLDPIASVVVSLLIIKAAVELIGPSVSELLEKSLPEYTERDILDVIAQFPQVSDPHHLRTRRIGNRVSVEVHVRMNGSMTVSQSHEVVCSIERRLHFLLGKDAVIIIHVEPVKPYSTPQPPQNDYIY